MQRPLISPLCFQRVKQSLLEKILRRCGAYYQSGDLFYQRLWHQHLSRIGFRVISVEKLPCHELWDIRLFGSLTAQSYLLLTKPVAKPHLWAKDLLLKQLHLEVQQVAKDFGAPMRRDCIHVARKGAYVRVTFIWRRFPPQPYCSKRSASTRLRRARRQEVAAKSSMKKALVTACAFHSAERDWR
jgi:hypothetical protein